MGRTLDITEFNMNKQHIKKLLRKDDPVIFEIGCADGKDTNDFISTFGPNLKIHCFEPEIKNIAIVKNTVNFGGHYLFEGAVSNKDGITTFHRSRTDNPDDLSYSGSIKRPKEHLKVWPFIKFDQHLEVKTITLDTYCKENNVDYIDFIWADVQGAEQDLVEGGKEMFANKIKYLYTEYSNVEYYENQANLQKILEALGPNWRLVHDFNTDVLLENILL